MFTLVLEEDEKELESKDEEVIKFNNANGVAAVSASIMFTAGLLSMLLP